MSTPGSPQSISVLCVHEKSNYFKLPGLDLYTASRDAYTFSGSNPVICHPPCQQWSQLHRFAKEDKKQKELALFCWNKVKSNGGIFEHPRGSHFFKYVNADRKKLFSINQSWFGFPAQKVTYLYMEGITPASYPLSFDRPVRTVCSLHSGNRSIMTLEFCEYLVNCCAPLIGLSYVAD